MHDALLASAFIAMLLAPCISAMFSGKDSEDAA
ncbi:hypothetical protein SAMN05421771_0734 [Granulicella pectinivorans]|jgi:hypothetical protein|uniref:Uncharacterized protein n=1 Tax=Granulicella pectinivorans TaxID=474950 RepID=A0A1I6LHW0_9BACT|nr:hypothetical protein SAMN05421771_0734 [Granulicella pectinivorans]